MDEITKLMARLITMSDADLAAAFAGGIVRKASGWATDDLPWDDAAELALLLLVNEIDFRMIQRGMANSN